MSDYVAATGRDKNSISVIDTPLLEVNLNGTIAPLLAEIAARIGEDAGLRHLGALR